MQQRNHYNTTFQKKTFPITIICDDVTNALNVGSLFRMSDAFGVEKIIFCGEHPPVFGRKMMKTSRATEKTVPYAIAQDINEVILDYKSAQYSIIALEITNDSKPITNFDFKSYKKIALVIGNENFGIQESILETVDATVHIDMFGNNSSMNVIQATNIALYEITKQLLFDN